MTIAATDLGSGFAASASALTLTLSVLVPASVLIVVAAAEGANAGNGSTITDDAGNSYSAINSAQCNGGGGGNIGLFYAWNAKPLTVGQRIFLNTTNGPTALYLGAIYATGVLASSDPQDRTVAATATGNSAAPSVTGAAATASAELVVGAAAFDVTLGSLAPAPGWTAAPDVNLTLPAAIGGTMQTAGGAPVTFNPSPGASAPWAALIAGFLSAPPPPQRPFAFSSPTPGVVKRFVTQGY